MLIQMRVAVPLQHAGAERPLSIGEVVDVSDVVGRAMVEDGYAVLAPMRAPETKGKRGQR